MKNRTYGARRATLSLALAAAFPLHAQVQLPETVVTASRVATPITDVIADVSVIDRAQLDLAGQLSLRDLLSQLPGVQITSNGSYRSSTGLFLRGASSSQTLILIDGVRVGSATSGGATLEKWFIADDPASFQDFSDIRMPARSTVTWKLDSGDFTWFRLEITEVEYR